MKKLSEILIGVRVLSLRGKTDRKIAGIHFDSRKIGKNDVFIAIKGLKTDGHLYIEKAIEQGVETVVCEILPEEVNPKITYVQVEDTHIALAKIAANYYNNPSHKIQLIGITGTNGKTTIASLLYQMFQHQGYKSGLLSTIANYIGEKKFLTTHTTLDALQINALLNKMVVEKCKYCFMEVSSHAIDQKRIHSLLFKGGIFTNITHDHLDYHKTFKDYIKTKKTFFDQLPEEAFVLSNSDDKNGRYILQNCTSKKYFYSIRCLKDFTARIIEKHFDGTLLEINKKEVWTHFIGCFNASNILAVFATARLLGVGQDAALQAISTLRSVRGRFETIISNDGIKAIIDYAHTPDALRNLLITIQNLTRNGDQIITVVGSGGDRDRSKRPEMGRIAAKYSHRVLLTSDNPRSEDPEKIIEQMKEGIPSRDIFKIISIVNRKEAIRVACTLAQKGDVVVVAGKGHETYQEIKGKKNHFDDKEIILENLKTKD